MDDEAKPLRIGNYEFGAKNLFVIALIIVGLFLAYVIFIKKKPAAATTASDTAATPTGSTGTGGTVVTNDPSAVGSIETQLEATQQSNLATQQTINGLGGTLTGIQGSLGTIQTTQTAQGQTLGTINKNAANAATDAAGARTDSSIALNGVNKLLAGKGYSTTNGPAWADVSHIGAAGLGI
jgi:hypothetical protein